MNRKLWLLAVLLLASFTLAQAQQQKVRRIGYLTTGSVSSAAPLVGAFLDGLRQLTRSLLQLRFSLILLRNQL